MSKKVNKKITLAKKAKVFFYGTLDINVIIKTDKNVNVKS